MFIFPLLSKLPSTTDDQGEWATATAKKKKQSTYRGSGYGNGSAYPNGGGANDRRGGRGGMDKMRGVSMLSYVTVHEVQNRTLSEVYDQAARVKRPCLRGQTYLRWDVEQNGLPKWA